MNNRTLLLLECKMVPPLAPVKLQFLTNFYMNNSTLLLLFLEIWYSSFCTLEVWYSCDLRRGSNGFVYAVGDYGGKNYPTVCQKCFDFKSLLIC